MKSLQELIASLSADDRERGLQFEQICSWFLQSDSAYRRLIRRTWLWRDWPGRWGSDAGIDLVAETHEGLLWAIQAKAYSSAHWIKKSDVDTFLSESARSVFTHRLLIATTDQLGKTAKRTIDAQEKPVGLCLLHHLEEANLDWTQPVEDLRPMASVTPKELFPHNLEAVRAVCRGFEVHDRGQLRMPCGTGKTLVGIAVSKELKSQNTLVLVPSLSLLSQTWRVWAANASPSRFLAVCSDETVADDDCFVRSTSDLGFPVTTDPERVAEFLRLEGPKVVFSTYHSSPVIAAALRNGTREFDLAIADEAHRCAAGIERLCLNS